MNRPTIKESINTLVTACASTLQSSANYSDAEKQDSIIAASANIRYLRNLVMRTARNQLWNSLNDTTKQAAIAKAMNTEV